VTLVFQRPGDRPQMHVLVVAVGAYPHLRGGDPDRRAKENFGLSQLTSPPVSAREFVSWLIQDHESPDAPLGTVDVLSSPRTDYPQQGGGTVQVEPAAWGTVEAAAKAWKRRCDTDERNTALFYFCGHGLTVESLKLLLTDFGADEDAPVDNAIDLNKMRLAMKDSAAHMQLFIVDACREVPRAAVDYPLGIGRSPLRNRVRGQSERRSVVLHSTTRGAQAYGDPDSVSEYTNALLAGLRGAAAEMGGDGNWIVTLISLAEALGELLRDATQKPTQEGESLLTIKRTLHRLPGPPTVRFEVTCEPLVELEHALLTLDAQPPYEGHWGRDVTSRAPWQVTVTAGQYLLAATSVGNRRWSQTKPRQVLAKPPRPVGIVRVYQ
jgi:hypothetical protein